MALSDSTPLGILGALVHFRHFLVYPVTIYSITPLNYY